MGEELEGYLSGEENVNYILVSPQFKATPMTANRLLL